MNPRVFASLLMAGSGLAPGLGGQTAPTPSAPAAPAVTISRSAEHRIASVAVGDTYVIQVRLPASYEKGTAGYPVLYVLDADMLFEITAGTADLLAWRKEIPELIVVGISYGETRRNWWAKRSRDLTPTPDRSKIWGDWPLAGGAAKFQDFLALELFPLVESRYRARAEDRTIAGLSFGGLFGTYTLFTKPELFQRYVLLAPSVIWDEKRMWEYEVQYRAQHTALPAIVFTAVGDRDDAPTNIRPWHEFNRLIEGRNYEGLRWVSHVFPDETHNSVFPAAVSRGLKTVYQSAKPAGAKAGDDTIAVKQFAAELDRCSHTADLEAFMALSSEDVVFLPPDQPAVEGAAAVREWYKGLWAALAIEMQHEVAEVQTVGDLIVARGSASGTATPRAGGPPVSFNNKYLFVLRRAPDGSLKAWRVIFNANTPANTPATVKP